MAADQTTTEMPRHPAEDALDFWKREAELQRTNLDAARRENINLEHHYRLALQEIRRLQDALIAARQPEKPAA